MSYIGITGFMHRQEVQQVLKDTAEAVQYSEHTIMIGVLASSKTLQGLAPKQWPNRYPKIDELPSIFVKNPRALGLIHYNAQKREDLFTELSEVANKCIDVYPGFQGFQLNNLWPDAEVLKRFRLKYRASELPMTLVLQIGERAFGAVGYSETALARKLQEYKQSIDHVLLDPSGGTGTPFNSEALLWYLRAIRDTGMNVGLGVAGGLHASTINSLSQIIDEFPNISIDAEAGLRNQEDHLDVTKAIAYVKSAIELFSDYKRC